MVSCVKIGRLWINLSFSLALLMAPLGEIRAQSVTVTCGQTLTADTVMANDLNDCPGDGLVLGASEIRLNCASHTITGSDTGIGIRISPEVGGVEIVNCNIRHFGTGLNIGGVGDHEILHNTITDNGVGVITGSGEQANVFADNLFNNPINVRVLGGGANQWDRPEGRLVAFRSPDKTLVMDDTNGEEDIFLHDRQLGITARVSVASDGAQADGSSDNPALSADGQVVIFQSQATNLSADEAAGEANIFAHDRQSGITTRLSLALDGSPTDGDSVAPAISADGRVVTFQSDATNLVADDANGADDIFVHDRQTGITARVSLATDGAEGDGRSLAPTISSDGLVVAFQSFATNFAAAADTNSFRDIYVRDLQTGATIRVSIAANGTASDGHSFNAALSAAGDIVAFQSVAKNLVAADANGKSDIFVHDRQSGETTRVSMASDGTEADGNSVNPVISAAGRFVAFRSVATNLVPDDTNGKADIFVHDRQSGETTRVSLATDGTEGDGNSQPRLAIGADGRLVAFQSFAKNLVSGDTNGARDTFVHDRQTGATTRVNPAPGGVEAKKASFSLAMTRSSREMNIVDGPFLGGNFYAKPGGTGFSQLCTDSNGDGLCDMPFAISEGNVDQFPLK